MIHRILMAGFGGQGVMLMGELLARGAMYMDKEVTFMPSYGPEMRGGTANCSVIISDKSITSPIITSPTELIAMNKLSLEKFEDSVSPGGFIYYNKSLMHSDDNRRDVTYIPVECNRLAKELYSEKISNIVMLGFVVNKSGIIPMEAVFAAMDAKFAGAKESFIPVNRKALSLWNEDLN
jgi:2-oxoglutarate ferredoxin oxidoreductase subunit gamma